MGAMGAGFTCEIIHNIWVLGVIWRVDSGLAGMVCGAGSGDILRRPGGPAMVLGGVPIWRNM